MRALKEGYHIFHAGSNEDRGLERIVDLLESQIKEAEKEYDIEFLSNAKIDSDPGGRNIYFGFQCAILHKKAMG